MKKNIITILSILLIGSFFFAGNALSEDLQDTLTDNPQIGMDPQYEIDPQENNDMISEDTNSTLEPEGAPDTDILLRDDIPLDIELEGEEKIVLEPGTIVE